MAVTQKQIAQELGVSHQLVSFALNDSGKVAEKTRLEILSAAERMGYRRNELARAVVTGRSRTIGIFTGEEITESMARSIAGALQAAADHGYSTKMMFVQHDASEEQTRHVMQRCTAWQLDAVLVVGISDPHVEMLRLEMARENRPIAFAGNLPPEDALGACSDDAEAWRQAVEYLVGQGHSRIAHLGAHSSSRIAAHRLELCLATLRDFGLEVDDHSSTFTCWGNPRLMEEGVHRLLDAPRPPSALLCAGDSLAMVAMRVARRRGLRIPEELSVIGFGDYVSAAFTDPALTSIAQPHEEVARRAMAQLLASLSGGAPSGGPERVPGCQLVVRDSTGPCGAPR